MNDVMFYVPVTRIDLIFRFIGGGCALAFIIYGLFLNVKSVIIWFIRRFKDEHNRLQEKEADGGREERESQSKEDL